MPRQVTKWEAATGGFYNTEEEAKTEEKRARAWARYQELSKMKLGSDILVATSFAVLWKNREEIVKLITKED